MCPTPLPCAHTCPAAPRRSAAPRRAPERRPRGGAASLPGGGGTDQAKSESASAAAARSPCCDSSSGITSAAAASRASASRDSSPRRSQSAGSSRSRSPRLPAPRPPPRRHAAASRARRCAGAWPFEPFSLSGSGLCPLPAPAAARAPRHLRQRPAAAGRLPFWISQLFGGGPGDEARSELGLGGAEPRARPRAKGTWCEVRRVRLVRKEGRDVSSYYGGEGGGGGRSAATRAAGSQAARRARQWARRCWSCSSERNVKLASPCRRRRRTSARASVQHTQHPQRPQPILGHPARQRAGRGRGAASSGTGSSLPNCASLSTSACAPPARAAAQRRRARRGGRGGTSGSPSPTARQVVQSGRGEARGESP